MHLATRVITYTGHPTFTLRPLGDVHLGTSHCDRKHFERDIKAIADDPHALWIGMGDYCEAITATDPRFMASEVDPEFLPQLGTIAVAQRDTFLKYVEPIKDKCVGLLEGNHELQIRARHYLDLTLDMCRELGVNYLGDTAFVRLCFCRTDTEGKQMRSFNVIIYAEHGTGGGREAGGKINSLLKMMADFDADIYLRGHVHDRLVVPKPRLSIPARGKAQLISKPRFAALTGCYYKTYEENTSSYGQRMSYPPTSLGSVTIRIDPATGEIEATI